MFGMWRRPHEVSNAAAFQIEHGQQADRQVGAGAAEVDRVEAAFVQRRRAGDEPVHVLVPRGDRVGLVEPDGLAERVPEPLHVGLAEHGPRPALVRVGDDRPVDEPLVQLAQVLLGERDHACLADAGAVEVAQELGIGVAGDQDHRAVLLAECLRPLEQPRRRPREDLLVGVLDHLAAHVLVRVEHVHVAGAGRIRRAAIARASGACSTAAPDVERLLRGDVGSHSHCKLRVALEPLVRDHVSDPTQFRDRAVGTRP